MRRWRNPQELTGRLRSSEVPRAISNLEVRRTNSTRKNAVDVCLASNIIEVGIDIDRLSIMAVVGQPKTTSQYIQVTGRVGRRWWERPGLVITLYGASRPRDRSHFEKFRTYHSQLYAQVEPTSVTPFSPPVLDRALHAIMAGYVRQRGDEEQSFSPYPYPENLVNSIRDTIREEYWQWIRRNLATLKRYLTIGNRSGAVGSARSGERSGKLTKTPYCGKPEYM